jgi:hypothetical protein
MADRSFGVKEINIVGSSAGVGTPTIESPNNLNLNANRVAISTNLTVGGTIVAGITSSIIPFYWENFADLPSFSEYHGAFAHVHQTGKAYYAHGRWVELVNKEANGTVGTGTENFNVGVVTAISFIGNGSGLTNDTVGDGTDVGFAIKYYITANGSSAYRFAGPGVLNSTDDPTIYLHRGFTYIFENSTGGSHPFAIRTNSGGSDYTSAFLSGSQTGTQVFTVPFDAPATLVYQCTIHGSMLGTFNIVT